MKIYSVGVTIYATVYVRGESAESAHETAGELRNLAVEVEGDDHNLFCGFEFNNPELPALSISPCVTIGDLEPVASVEEVAE
ncbi:hypothetical protein [Brucella sp.]|uniref:hypothetical protein n=1 Tax=Brucella sp. TaxID=52132 RepID=UPI0028AA39D6|nr:hypothetical protein [Brucella sp.]